MTHLTKAAALGMILLGLPAYAAGEDAGTLDANGDGMVSVTEVQAVYPEITAEQFSTMDLNGDGALDEAEMTAASDAGLMPSAAPSEG
ncbi:hypothetical protein ACFSUD_03940 [Sulfitobacter aestuarii]|uniref:EF-hand domain-containing protein n=1 Tax=Sulfitobacter aestuarii TaxID=2161676 RepID=A0ABW5U196_9RHOB